MFNVILVEHIVHQYANTPLALSMHFVILYLDTNPVVLKDDTMRC